SVQGAKVTAVCSRRELNEGELEKQFGARLKTYRSYDAMLADPDIHVVDICTPHPLHPGQAIAAAQAAKHLIIEKSIALTYSDAKAVGDAIKKAGVHACICFEVRY